jgi:hypothetical protein
MIDEILSDFFHFVSIDKQSITKDDLRKLEYTIDKPEFQDISEQLEEFLNQFVSWSIKKLNINIEAMEDSYGNKIVNYSNLILKVPDKIKNKPELKSQKTGNSVRQMYRKNVDFVTIKTSDFGISFRIIIKYKNLDLNITYTMLNEFYEINPNFLNTILKFITRKQTILINERLVRKTKSSQKFRRIIPGEKPSPIPRRKGEGKKKKSKNKFFMNSNDVRNPNDISDCNISNISNDISAHHKSFVSDNEVVTHSKVNFLRVMKDVTKNIIKEMKENGKEIPIKLDDAIKNDLLVDNSKLNPNIEKSKIIGEGIRFRDNLNEVEMHLDESNIPNDISQNDLSFNSNIIEEIEKNNYNISPERKSRKIPLDPLANSRKSKKGDPNIETKSKKDPNMDTKDVKTSADINIYSKQIEISIQNKLGDTKNNSIKPSNTLQVEQNKNERKKNKGGCRCLIY